MKVLIVEDNPANMKLAADLLTGQGYTVLQATDAGTGIRLVQAEKPDLVLMDIQLPDMDGLTATGILKKDPATRDIPIIALTAFAMRDDEATMLAAGCDGYIAKPIRYREFLATVKQFLRQASKTYQQANYNNDETAPTV